MTECKTLYLIKDDSHIRSRVIGTDGAIEVGLRSRNVSVWCNTERV